MPEYKIAFGKDFLKDLKKIIKGGDKKIKGKVENILVQITSEPHKKGPGSTSN